MVDNICDVHILRFLFKRALRTLIVAITLGMGTIGVSANVSAGSTSTNVSVTATVIANCKLQDTGPTVTLNFGNYDPASTNFSSALEVNDGFDIRCSKGVTAHIALNTGLHGANASGTTRAMSNGTEYLSYEIYSNSGMTSVWDNVNTVEYVSSGNAPAAQSVYAKIIPGQDVSVGTYTDTVVATTNF